MKTHSQQVGQGCIAKAKAKWGRGWPLLSEEMKKAAICEEVVWVLLAQDAFISQINPAKGLEHVTEVAREAINRTDLWE